MTYEEACEESSERARIRELKFTPQDLQFVAEMGTLCAHAARLEEWIHHGTAEGVAEQDAGDRGVGLDLVGFEESETWERFCRRYPDYWHAVHTEMYRVYKATYLEKK